MLSVCLSLVSVGMYFFWKPFQIVKIYNSQYSHITMGIIERTYRYIGVCSPTQMCFVAEKFVIIYLNIFTRQYFFYL